MTPLATHIHDGCGHHHTNGTGMRSPRCATSSAHARQAKPCRQVSSRNVGPQPASLDPYVCTKAEKGVRGSTYVLAAGTFRADGGAAGGGGGGGRPQDPVGRVQDPVADRWAGHPHRGLPVPHRLRHRRLRRPHRQGRARRRLHCRRRHRRPRLRAPAWHGERPGDAVRAGGGGRAAPHAGRVHAAVVDHLPRHGRRPAPGLHVHGPDPPPAPAVPGDLGRGGAVRALVRAAALRLRRQLPHAEVLPGAEPGVGHDGHLWRRRRRARAAQLGGRGQARPRPPGRGHGRQRLLVAHQRGAVRVRRRRLLPGGVDGVLAQGVRQPRRLRPALPRVRRYALLGDVVLYSSNHSSGLLEEPRDSSRGRFHMHELQHLDTDGIRRFQCRSERSRGERTWRQAPESGQVLGGGGGDHVGRHRARLHARHPRGEEAAAEAFHRRRARRRGGREAGVPSGCHHRPQQHPAGAIRGGHWSWVAVLGRLGQHRLLLSHRPAPCSRLRLQAQA